jgi:hypothetical protein
MNRRAAMKCVGCEAEIRRGDSVGVMASPAGEMALCRACWAKCERAGRKPCDVIEAVALSWAPEFGGPDSDADHEDFRDLELLGLWP